MISTPRNRFILFAVVSYVLLALVWIFLSDRLLVALTDKALLLQLSTVKGDFFVLVSALVFFFMLRAVPSATAPPRASWLNALLLGTLPWSRLLIYVVAIMVTLAMLILRLNIQLDINSHPMTILFMLPVILSALSGGLGPGLLSTALAVTGLDLLAKPYLHSAATDPAVQLQWAFLMLNGVAISLLSALLRQSLARQEVNRQLLNAVVAGSSDAIFVKDKQGHYLMLNSAAAAFVGKPREEIIGRDDYALFDEVPARSLIERDRQVMQSGQVQTAEEVLRMSDQRQMVFQVTKGPIFDGSGELGGLFGIAHDITEQRRSEQALRASEHALKEAQRLAGIGSWSWQIDGNVHFWSEEIYAIYGRDPALPAAVYPEVQHYFTPDSWETLAATVEQCLISGEPYECDAEVVRPDGTHRLITARGEVRRDEAGHVVQLHGTVQDITERQLMALQLKDSEQRLKLVVDATSDGFWDWDLRSGHVYRSPRYYEVTGYSPDDDSGTSEFFRRLVHPDDLPLVLRAIDAHKAGHSARIACDFRLLTRSGDSKWMSMSGRIVEWDESGVPQRVVGTLSDITERKRVDDDLHCVLNEAGDAIWMAAADGRYLFANPAACRISAYSAEQLCRMSMGDLLQPENGDELGDYLQQRDHLRAIRREWPLLRADGQLISIELSLERMQDGRHIIFGRDLTEQKRAELALRDREQRLARVLEGSDQGYWDWNLQSNVFQVSARWESMLGYAAGEMDVSPEHWPELVHADDLAVAMASLQRHLSGHSQSHEVEMRCATKSGGWRWILSRGRVVSWDKQGQPLMMSGTHTDITEHKLLELAQKEAAVVFDSSYEGIMVVSPDNLITKVNAAFSRITGYSAADVLGQPPTLLASGQHSLSFYEDMWDSVNQHDFWRGEIWNKRKNGEIYAELLSISVVRDEQGKLQHYVGIFSDISQLKAHEAELDRIANFDPLTGAPNRRLLSDRLGQSIIHASRSGQSCAVCFIDLDGFKSINDEYGHSAGDQLLIGVTNNLKRVLRAADTLARLGGDEFVLLLSDIGSTRECMQLLDRILTAAREAVDLGDVTIHSSASIGVSLYPEDNVDADTLLRHADQAMYLAKQDGKNCYRLFDPESDRKAQSLRKTLAALQQALANDEFVLYYQPKVDLCDGSIIGAEALIRWQHPQQGLLPPAEFLPFLHGSELEIAFGQWVLNTAVAQAEQWCRQGLAMPVSINISANYLLLPAFSQHLQQALAHHPDMPPHYLELEVLESAAIADMAQAVDILQRCRKLGVQFSLDDFGTGYSSLTYLRKLPVDTLKIDQSFVRTMLSDSDDLGIVEGVIQLAAVFRRKVIAEGVETLEHGAMLRRLGCRLAQGYGIARPMAAPLLPGWCGQWRQQALWQKLDGQE